MTSLATAIVAACQLLRYAEGVAQRSPGSRSAPWEHRHPPPVFTPKALYNPDGALLADPETVPPSRLARIELAPDFSLTTQAGDSLSLKDLRGKVLLASFVFTTCNGA